MTPKDDDPDLKRLQKIWYQKLKDAGFADIEDTLSRREYLKTWHASYFRSRYTVETFIFKQNYFRRASHFLYEHVFQNPLEREIWSMHSEGLSLREISRRLKRPKLGKDSIHKIIAKLVDLMKGHRFEDADDHDET